MKVNRRMDDLGRIVIPKEIRKRANIKCSDNLSIEYKDNSIILKKAYIEESVLNRLEDWLKEQIELVRDIPTSTKEIQLIHTQQIALYQDILDKIQELKNERRNKN